MTESPDTLNSLREEINRVRTLVLRIQERWVSSKEPYWCTFCNQHRKRHSERCVLGLLDEILYKEGHQQP